MAPTGKAKMQFPMNHAALPLGPKELLELGVGYNPRSPGPASGAAALPAGTDGDDTRGDWVGGETGRRAFPTLAGSPCGGRRGVNKQREYREMDVQAGYLEMTG